MKKKRISIQDDNEEQLLLFLSKTKDGEYAPIDNEYEPITRVIDENQLQETLDDVYLYSIS